MSGNDRVRFREEMMKIRNLAFILLLVLTACAGTGKSTQTPTSGLPTPVVNTTSVPDVTASAQAFLDKWKASDYAGMYAALAQTSKDAISQTDFEKKYQNTATNMTLSSLDYGILSTLIKPASAVVGYQINFSTSLFSKFQRQMEMNLVLESGAWKVQWEDGMILPELKGGNSLLLNITHPVRGDILDRNGDVIATQTDAVALGIDPANVTAKGIKTILQLLAEMTQKPNNIVEDAYKAGVDQFYIPMGEVSKEGYTPYASSLELLGGFIYNEYNSRYYYFGGIAPQAVGYTQFINETQLAEYKARGYAGDEKIGASGLEKWGETILAGGPTADLYVMGPTGATVTRLAHQDPKAPDNITTTLDRNLQLQVQKALLGFTGAAVVMEVNTGRVLAMASSPSYDPNAFQTNNYNSQYQLGDLVNDPTSPLWNRAAQSSYPLGSVFKLVTMSAALESGLYTPNTIFDCTSQWTELGTPYNDWTFDKGLPPSGPLTLVQGLMRSCNPYFYHIGLDLFRQKGASYLADMARGFGLGSATGIDAISEETGAINNPTDDGSASQMGIGQGDMLVTPLQVVDFVAALANGGTLYRPQIIEKVTTIDGIVVSSFSPEIRGKLPISDATLAAVREGMNKVVNDSKGTAYTKFLGIGHAIFGKTGTATTSQDKPHAWFAGYTAEKRQDKPDIAVVVIAENSGDGSVYAAPIFRRIIESYYTGSAITQFPWESAIYMTQTPTAGFETTPAP
jgi:penicillin-binding protein 2